MRTLLRRAERTGMVVIPQKEGPPARFPQSALAEAFICEMSRMCGEDREPHPLHVAVRDSTDPELYAGTFLDSEMRVVGEDGEDAEPGEDLYVGGDLSE